MKRMIAVLAAMGFVAVGCGDKQESSSDIENVDLKVFNTQFNIRSEWNFTAISPDYVTIEIPEKGTIGVSYTDVFYDTNTLVGDNYPIIQLNSKQEFYEHEKSNSLYPVEVITNECGTELLWEHSKSSDSFLYNSYMLFSNGATTSISFQDSGMTDSEISALVNTIKECDFSQIINTSKPEYMTDTYYNTGRELVSLLDEVCDKSCSFKNDETAVLNCINTISSYECEGEGSITVTIISSESTLLRFDYEDCVSHENKGSLSYSDYENILKYRNKLAFYFNIEAK